MKGKKIKTETILLGLVIIALLIYLLVRNPDQIQYEIPEMDQIKASEIVKIEIIKAVEAITLNKKNNQWVIQTQGYLADSEKIKKLTDIISGLKLTDVISESKNYYKYGLDEEKKITVKAHNSKEVVREFVIGKEAATYRHTFTKIPGDPRVFHARNSFRRDFDQKVADFRDKTVLKFAKNEINTLQMKSDKTSLIFQKKTKEIEIKTPDTKDQTKKPPTDSPVQKQLEEYWTLPDGQIGKKGEIEAIINFLSDLKCSEYIEDKTKDDFKEPIYQITLKGGKDYSLLIYKKEDDNKGQYPVMSSKSAYPFWLSSYNAERVMKKQEELIQKPKKK